MKPLTILRYILERKLFAELGTVVLLFKVFKTAMVLSLILPQVGIIRFGLQIMMPIDGNIKGEITIIFFQLLTFKSLVLEVAWYGIIHLEILPLTTEEH